MAREKDDAQDLAAATMAGFEALVQELKAQRAQSQQHEKEVINRLGRYKENPEGSPKISVFNQRGQRDYPLPQLKCRVFAPHPLDRDPEISGLTREEIELVNLLEPGEYRITLNDQSQTALTVQTVKNAATGAIEQMRIVTPAFDREKFKTMPPMATWLREVLAQHPEPIAEAASQVLTMKQEQALIAKGALAVAV